MTELALVERTQRREITQVIDAVPILDSARFEHMQRIANVLAHSSMIPETLRTVGRRDDKEPLPFEQIISNCFLVVNQAARWGMDPFAVISCCSVVHGRLSYEGKLVAAVLDAKLGVQLHFHFTGTPTSDDFRIYVCDQPFTEAVVQQLKPGITVPGLSLWDGSVGEWKTTGAGTPWTAKNYKRMLIYRGTRDWARIYKPAIMLGVYTDDELLDLAEDARARRALPAPTLRDRLAANPSQGGEGFSQQHVISEIDGSQPNGGDPADAAASHAGSSDAAADNSDSSRGQHPPSPPSPETTPATDAPPPDEVAGTPSESSVTEQAADDDAQAGDGRAADSGLPSGWEQAYVAALRRAQKADSLRKFAGQFWAEYGGWDQHKDGPDAERAAAIFNAFKNHFGKTDEINVILRELEAI